MVRLPPFQPTALRSQLTSPRYPFHLRPKNKQVFHYLRMCSDLITDLELDQGPVLGEPAPDVEASNEQLDGIRAYLAHCHLVAS